MTPEKRKKLAADFATAINCNSAENQSNTPDFILAEYLVICLEAFGTVSNMREAWYGHSHSIGGSVPAGPASATPSPSQGGGET